MLIKPMRESSYRNESILPLLSPNSRGMLLVASGDQKQFYQQTPSTGDSRKIKPAAETSKVKLDIDVCFFRLGKLLWFSHQIFDHCKGTYVVSATALGSLSEALPISHSILLTGSAGKRTIWLAAQPLKVRKSSGPSGIKQSMASFTDH